MAVKEREQNHRDSEMRCRSPAVAHHQIRCCNDDENKSSVTRNHREDGSKRVVNLVVNSAQPKQPNNSPASEDGKDNRQRGELNRERLVTNAACERCAMPALQSPATP